MSSSRISIAFAIASFFEANAVGDSFHIFSPKQCGHLDARACASSAVTFGAERLHFGLSHRQIVLSMQPLPWPHQWLPPHGAHRNVVRCNDFLRSTGVDGLTSALRLASHERFADGETIGTSSDARGTMPCWRLEDMSATSLRLPAGKEVIEVMPAGKEVIEVM